LKSQRDFRNYLAGGALAFGVVLLTSQILQLMYGGLNAADMMSTNDFLTIAYIASHIGGGFLGGYLVARVRRADYINTGVVTGVLAYIFELAYNIIFEGWFTGIYAVLFLLIGGIIGAMFIRTKLERDSINGLGKKESKPPSPASELS
jgi:CHASE2 domain-containing sensor protein